MFTATDLSGFPEMVFNHTSCTGETEGLCNILKAGEYLTKVMPLMQEKGLLMSLDHHSGSNLGFLECCNLCQRVMGTSSISHLGESIKIPQCPDMQ